MVRSRLELEQKLAEQLSLLTALGRLYDEDTPAAALPLATCLRVLLHDTASSRSLLAQLGDLATMMFVDTSAPPLPDFFQGGLVIDSFEGIVAMELSTGTGASYVPLLGSDPERMGHQEPFSTWWETVVMNDADGHVWTRKAAVLALANKEGGAHIDPRQPESIRALEVHNSMGWVQVRDGQGPSPFNNTPLAPTVRQIAYEVESTLADVPK
jgi:hypothetical protein